MSAAVQPALAAAADPLDRLILLLGGPRSGTTWLAKILDSHPDILYRHEPDIDLRAQGIPGFVDQDQIPRHQDAMRGYLRALLDVRTLKAVSTLPLFPKRHEGAAGHRLRQGAILGLKALEQLEPVRGWARRQSVPDFGRPLADPAVRPLIKSVSSLGRAGLIAAAAPGAHVLVIIRHPCGQIASSLRGTRLGKFDGAGPVTAPTGEVARRYGLSPESFDALPDAEKHAWQWVVGHEVALQALRENPRARTVIYERLCADPIGVSRELFAFCGLSFAPATEAFLRASTTSSGPDRYFGLFKDSAAMADKWRTEMAPEDQAAIMAVVERTPLAALFADAR